MLLHFPHPENVDTLIKTVRMIYFEWPPGALNSSFSSTLHLPIFNLIELKRFHFAFWSAERYHSYWNSTELDITKRIGILNCTKRGIVLPNNHETIARCRVPSSEANADRTSATMKMGWLVTIESQRIIVKIFWSVIKYLKRNFSCVELFLGAMTDCGPEDTVLMTHHEIRQFESSHPRPFPNWADS